MGQCPFCSAPLADGAEFCPACHEPVATKTGDPEPWYFRTSFIILALCCVGPLALPLIWFRPRTAVSRKIGLTLVILLVSWLLYYAALATLDGLREVYRFLDSLE